MAGNDNNVWQLLYPSANGYSAHLIGSAKLGAAYVAMA